MSAASENARQMDAGRREFLRLVVRCAAAGALVAGTGVLVARRAARLCPGALPCARCSSYGGCELPAAMSARANAAKA